MIDKLFHRVTNCWYFAGAQLTPNATLSLAMPQQQSFGFVIYCCYKKTCCTKNVTTKVSFCRYKKTCCTKNVTTKVSFCRSERCNAPIEARLLQITQKSSTSSFAQSSTIKLGFAVDCKTELCLVAKTQGGVWGYLTGHTNNFIGDHFGLCSSGAHYST